MVEQVISFEYLKIKFIVRLWSGVRDVSKPIRKVFTLHKQKNKINNKNKKT